MKMGILLAGIALFIGACTSGRVYQKGYAGDDVPLTLLALLKPASSIRMEPIDGDGSRALSASQSFGNTDYEIGLKPGDHTVLLTYYNGVAFSLANDAQTALDRGDLKAEIAFYNLSETS